MKNIYLTKAHTLFDMNYLHNNSLIWSLQLPDYMGSDWTGTLEISQDLEEFRAIAMETEVDSENLNRHLSLGIHTDQSFSMDLHLYSPYWVVNKTDLPLQLRAKLRVYESRWSQSFSTDTVGSGGVVICHDKERGKKYMFMVQISLSKLQLTKIVTIVPFFLVINSSSQKLRYMEENEQADLWIDVDKDQRAICVEVTGGTDAPITIIFTDYEPGDAPARDGSGEIRLQVPSLRSTNSAGLVVQDTAETDDSSSPEDESDEVDGLLDHTLLSRTRVDKMVIFWVSYLDGMQRSCAKCRFPSKAQGAAEGVSVSVINAAYKELALLSICSSPSVWEVEVKNKWRQLDVELATWLEDQWRGEVVQASLHDQIQADLGQMQMTKPYMGALRRSFHPGIWCQYRGSKHHMALNMAVQSLQSFQLQQDLMLARQSLKEATSVLLHLSFSLGGTAHLTTFSGSVVPQSTTLRADIVDFFLNSVGVTLTEIKNVELKMAYFERKGVLLSTGQLLAQAQSHFTQQALQQAYVLILGLDVLGNPYGLVKDFTQGLGDFFYQPFLAVQLDLSLKSLVV
ncbi:vacuolar protein sorting-associated protein 13c [Plakobranchus ocellatus]|uniref:Vacuolar protein sorting-associated protein 13c n=1 Tax=Plakobranchus ocellatus TaxID=259542 RepID=A0AAV4DFQ8_9GAST|nr:vacuolar protein sorting-associated protein 13c [Plakobranchus ocellatus]